MADGQGVAGDLVIGIGQVEFGGVNVRGVHGRRREAGATICIAALGLAAPVGIEERAVRQFSRQPAEADAAAVAGEAEAIGMRAVGQALIEIQDESSLLRA